MIKIKWYRKIIETRWSWDHWSSDMDQFEILYTEGNKKMCAKLDNDYWDCYSWYCEATRGSMDIVEVSNFWELHFVPTQEIVLDRIGHFVDVQDNGDEYYPSWSAYIKEEFLSMFKETPRKKDKKQVYLFQWESWIGKSYLGRQLSLDVYETDSNEELPERIKEQVVVVWNKYNHNIKDIIKRCWRCDIINVNFIK